MKRSLMPRIAQASLLGVLSLLTVAIYLREPLKGAMETPPEKEIERWVEDLGNVDFKRREDAMRRLMELDDVPPLLQRELASPDLEVRRRVAQLLEMFLQKRVRRGLAKVRGLAKEGRVDEMVERLVLWSESDKRQEWKALTEFVGGVVEKSERAFGKTRFQWIIKPIKTNADAGTIVPKNLVDVWQANPILIRQNDIPLDPVRGNDPRRIIIATGDVHTILMMNGIIATGGNVRLSEALHSVIICDGDCEIQGGLTDTLIIARGKVICPQQVNHSVIISENFIVFPKRLKLYQSTISNGGPNQFVHFFDPEDVGLTVRSVHDREGRPLSDGGTWIHAIRKESRFSSGLRATDVVAAIDATKTPSPDIFRKVLRRKLAEGGPTLTFTVKRGKQTLNVAIPISTVTVFPGRVYYSTGT